jgi:hypothetical protein
LAEPKAAAGHRLSIVESHSPVADLLPENTIFFNQKFDDVLLTGNRNNKK